MKVYIITQGNALDYHIVGVTLDREVAEKCIKVHGGEYDPPRIEEYETNEFPQYTRKSWVVTFSPCKIEEVEISEYIEFVNSSSENYQYVLADTEAHALKIAQDRRGKLLAERAGL